MESFTSSAVTSLGGLGTMDTPWDDQIYLSGITIILIL